MIKTPYRIAPAKGFRKFLGAYAVVIDDTELFYGPASDCARIAILVEGAWWLGYCASQEGMLSETASGKSDKP